MTLSAFSLRTTPDDVLIARLRQLATMDAELDADVLVHLGEVDARGLALRKGYSSLFTYCVEVLHFSEWAAYHRIAAARAARAYPLVLERVRSGEIHLSGLRLLLPQMNAENCRELLDLARHQSKRAIEERLADRAPKPDVRSQVRAVPEPIVLPAAPAPAAWPAEPMAFAPTSVPAPPPPRCVPPEPLGASRYKVQFTAGPELHAKLVEAQALLRHQIPDGDVAGVFERALNALLREARRAKFAETDRPCTPRAESRPATRHIPAWIRREVAERDQRRCTYVSPDGRRCAAQDALEFHHRIPFARSRRHRAAEITLRCRAHNAYAATIDFGVAHMARVRRTCPGASSHPPNRADLPQRPDV